MLCHQDWRHRMSAEKKKLFQAWIDGEEMLKLAEIQHLANATKAELCRAIVEKFISDFEGKHGSIQTAPKVDLRS